jgi:hypothetical protein
VLLHFHIDVLQAVISKKPLDCLSMDVAADITHPTFGSCSEQPPWKWPCRVFYNYDASFPNQTAVRYAGLVALLCRIYLRVLRFLQAAVAL